MLNMKQAFPQKQTGHYDLTSAFILSLNNVAFKDPCNESKGIPDSEGLQTQALLWFLHLLIQPFTIELHHLVHLLGVFVGFRALCRAKHSLRSKSV